MKTRAVSAYLALWRAARAAQTYDHARIQEYGMGLSDFGVLEFLLHKGPSAISSIGERLLLTSGSMTSAVDRLERQGLVERCADPSDRRARIIHLTGDGRRTIESLFARHEQAMEELFAPLADADRRRLVRLLGTLKRRAEELREPGGS